MFVKFLFHQVSDQKLVCLIMFMRKVNTEGSVTIISEEKCLSLDISSDNSPSKIIIEREIY